MEMPVLWAVFDSVQMNACIKRTTKYGNTLISEPFYKLKQLTQNHCKFIFFWAIFSHTKTSLHPKLICKQTITQNRSSSLHFTAQF